MPCNTPNGSWLGMVKLTERVRNIEYAIRDVVVHAKRLEKAGRKVIYLNIGDPVKYDFPTPQHIKGALIEAVKGDFNWYAPSEGLPELREAVCEKEKKYNRVDLSPEDVIVTHGVSEGIQMVMAALVEPGAEVLVPGPSYPPYPAFIKFFGGKPVAYRTVEEAGWQPDVEDMASKVTAKTCGIVVVNPNNPCGALYEEQTIKDIVDLAAQHGLPVFSDEIYDRIVYGRKFTSTSAVAGETPVIGLNGFSKTYLMTGWRLGYVYIHDPEGKLGDLKQNIEKEARIRLSANTPMQKAAVAALRGPQDHIPEMVEKLRARRDYVWRRFNEMKGLSCAKPEGAFYVFPKIEDVSRWGSDRDFALSLLDETGVLLVHGSGFDTVYGFSHFRMVFLPPLETLEEALDRLEKFMAKN